MRADGNLETAFSGAIVDRRAGRTLESFLVFFSSLLGLNDSHVGCALL